MTRAAASSGSGSSGQQRAPHRPCLDQLLAASWRAISPLRGAACRAATAYAVRPNRRERRRRRGAETVLMRAEDCPRRPAPAGHLPAWFVRGRS